MRLHRFFIQETIDARTDFTLHSSDLVNQVRKVFRLKTGDSLIVFDGSGSDYTCQIRDFGKDSIDVSITETARSRYMPEREVTLYAAVVKKDTFEWIVEKATELGVTKIVPVLTERTEKKALNESRLKKIALEASEQSGRGNVPVISAVTSLSEALQQGGTSLKKIAFHTEGEVIARWNLAEDKKDDLAVFIGPEGGWSPDEVGMFHAHKIPVLSLGNQVLRAETAVISALSLTLLGK